MKAKLTMMVAMAAACAAIQLTAMSTEEETRKAEPVVKKMLAQERAALESGRKTRSEVADAAMKLADEADTDAAKLLLMKGAFTLYVKDGNHEKAVETMRALEAAILDMPPQSVTNMIEGALLGVSKKEERARLYKLLGETKADIPSYDDLSPHVESKAIAASVKERSSVASILKSMIKLPGRDCWLSATEVTQGQWESVMGYNPSSHKGADLPVENVSRDDCDKFLKKLNATKEVQASQFEFRLPSYEEWVCAAGAGSPGNNFWIKPGVAGSWRRLDMAWLQDNSSNQTHVVATKAPNAFGFYDMLGNVWEWTTGCDAAGREYARGGSFNYHSGIGTYRYWLLKRSYRSGAIGLRLAAYTRSKTSSDGCRKAGSSESDAAQRQETVDGFAWSYRVKNGEAMIVAANGRCAVSPSPKGAVSIPSTLGGVKVTSIGNNVLRNCRGLMSVTIPSGVTSIGDCAFLDCCELKLVTIPSSVRNVGAGVFRNCFALKSLTIPSNVERIGAGAFWNCRGLTSVTIPAKVASVGCAAFSYCSALRQINVDPGNQTFTSIDGVLYTKDRSVLLACPNALTSVEIPKSVTNIGWCAFEGCSGLKSVTIPEGVASIEAGAFKACGGLVSVTIPSSVKIIWGEAFWNCKGLKSVTLQEGVEVIDGSAFNRCSGLTSLVLPSSVKSIGSFAFEGCGELTSLTLPQGLTKIDLNAFRGLNKLTTVTIPASVTDIGGAVFSYCGGLTQINVAAGNQKYTSVDGVLYTKDRTELVMCPNGLKSVTIPGSVTNIGLGAFIGCSKLTSVMLPSNVKSIGAWAFEGCNGLTSVTIPENVTKIDQYAFVNCGGLTSLTMRGERPDAPNNIFQGCGKLKSIRVPANAKSWAGMKKWHGIPLVFDGESKADGSLNGEKDVEYKFAYKLDDKGNAILTGVSPKPEGALVCPNIIEGHKVTGIDRGAFGGCDKMTKIMLPEDLDTLPLWISGWCIHGSIFYGCTALSSIGISEKNLKFASVDGALYSKDKKVLFAYPKDRTEIKVCRETTSLQGEAFHSSLLFKKINVPEGILDASGFAFSGCPNLEEVVFPKGFEYIRHRAFWSCPNMKKVVFLGEAPVAPHRNTAWRENVFCGAARDIVVYVRKGSKGWNGKESTDLPERWPLDGSDSRPIRYIDEADAKSWAGVKDGQGIPLVFDGEQAAEAAQQQAAAEREQQLKVLRQLQEELRRQRKEKDAAQRRAGQAVNAAVQQQQATVDGYTWSYRVKYGAATIVSEKKGKYSCAVSPMPTGDVKIPVTLNGVKVTSIGDHAFLMCDGMTSVTIPSGVTNIGWSAFSGCRRLTSVTIPEGVKCIGKGAISGCCGLTLVTIPASVMYIEDEAFSSSPKLYNRETNGWSVRRGKGPTGNSLVSFAVDSDNPSYSSRNGLLCSKDGADLIVGVNGDINIPDGVKNISKYAFSDCRNLSSVTIPSSVTNIGFRAFYNCSALKFVTIPDNVTSIGASAFSGCSGLTSVTIPDSVTSIGASAFSGCSGLTSVKIPDSVTSIGSDAFAGTPFYGNQPDGMVVLGGGVLYAYKGECPSSVTIPSSVTSIGKRAFAACRGRLESVTIPSSVTNIDENAFWYCSGVKSFSVASDNPSYSSRNRMLCTKGGATLIAGVIGVNGNATIPEGVANIGSSAFNGYSGLKSVTIPNGVTNIESWAFHGCRGLTSVAIPEGVTSIGADAFLDCRGLTSVTIPDSVTSIGVCAFNGTPFYGKMPDGMVVLGGGVLCGYKGKCPSTVVIPSNVTSIAEEAFSERFLHRSGAGLKMVVISSSVTNIGSRVFSCCGDLTNLTMRGECPKAPNDIFQNCGKLKAIHVPANAKSWVGMKAWQGIPLVFDGEDAGRQAQAEHGAAPKGGLARLRQRRMEAERQAAESAQRQAAAEREQQLKALLQIQEELRRQREAKQAEKEAGVSGIQTKKFPLAQGLELEMIKCPAGEFMMGYESWNTWASSQNKEQRKLHRVKLTKDFMLGKFPVTCSQWYAIMGNGKKAPEGLEDTPVGNITVPEMQAFCDKLTERFKAQLGGKVFRLPTDAEWEYASKGGKNLDGMLGKTLGLNGNTGSSSRDGKEVEAIFRQMGYTAEDHARASDTNKPFFMWNPLAVGKYKPNEWGFMDLTGNAWEVTADTIMDTVLSKEGGVSSFIHVWNGRQIYSDFEIDPLLKGERHLVRTGFWEKGIAHGIGNKMGIGDNDRFPAVGFRVCIGEPLQMVP